MDNLRVAILLHFYQPWWQFTAVLNNIVSQCYRPIIDLVNRTDGFCFTANINLSLLELLEKDFPDVISGFQEAVRAGKLELVGSPAEHPIVPLIPDKVRRAQIEKDLSDKEDRFGLGRNCTGFYLPEMAFSGSSVGLLRDYGYQWTVVEDIPFSAVHGYVPFDHIITSGGFKTFMRSNRWSDLISGQHLSFAEIKSKMKCEIPAWMRGRTGYVVMAMDAETFGHHNPYLIDSCLRPMLSEWSGGVIRPIESLVREFPWRNLEMPDGSWSTSVNDVSIGDPYPLWNSRFNIYHRNLWRLVNMALNYFDNEVDACLKMTSSCHWWWISGRPYWNPEFMKFGAKKAFDIIRDYGSQAEKESAQNLYSDLMKL